jgi:hypothetical protein
MAVTAAEIDEAMKAGSAGVLMDDLGSACIEFHNPQRFGTLARPQEAQCFIESIECFFAAILPRKGDSIAMLHLVVWFRAPAV